MRIELPGAAAITCADPAFFAGVPKPQIPDLFAGLAGDLRAVLAPAFSLRSGGPAAGFVGNIAGGDVATGSEWPLCGACALPQELVADLDLSTVAPLLGARGRVCVFACRDCLPAAGSDLDERGEGVVRLIRHDGEASRSTCFRPGGAASALGETLLVQPTWMIPDPNDLGTDPEALFGDLPNGLRAFRALSPVRLWESHVGGYPLWTQSQGEPGLCESCGRSMPLVLGLGKASGLWSIAGGMLWVFACWRESTCGGWAEPIFRWMP